jgi:DNA-damage-inducible protein J
MSTIQLATRVSKEAEQKFRENTRRLGTTPSDALRMFIAAFNECNGFPYDVRIDALRNVEPFATEHEATEFATKISLRAARDAR